MLTSVNIAEIILPGMFYLMGVMGNSFIVTVNVKKWVSTANKINVRDLLASSLGVSNLCHTCVCLAGNICYVGLRRIFLLDIVYNSYVIVVCSSDGFSLWFATWLCVYYCTKIVIFNQPLFIWLLLGSALVSLTVNLSTLFETLMKLTSIPPSNLSQDTSSNASGAGNMRESSVTQRHTIGGIMQYMFNSVAFLILFFSSGAIITSLYRHVKQVSQNADYVWNPGLSAHLGAMKTMTLLLVLCLFSYLGKCFALSEVFSKTSVEFITIKIMISAFPALSSIVLIFGNRFLKKKLAGIFCRGEGT